MDRFLSVVIPCYNSQNNIEKVIQNAEEVFKKEKISNYEFILVNDCSRDNTWQTISKLADSHDNIISVDLAKNCGQHGALMAGFHYVSGEYVVTCEDDGQTQIEKIIEMLDKINEGYDVVSARYIKRPTRSLFRRFGSWVARCMGRIMMPKPKGVSVSIFFLARRFVIEEMIKYTHSYPYITGLILRTTHNIGNVDVEQLERMSGESGYNFRKLISLWMNGFTAFSIQPLRIATILGMVSAACGIIYAIVIIIQRLAFRHVIAGWSSIMVVMLVMFGVVLVVLGMIGEYVGRIYLCINNTPQYTVRRVEGENTEDATSEGEQGPCYGSPEKLLRGQYRHEEW